MKSFVSKPTTQNLIDYYIEDHIGRNADIVAFIKVLETLDENTSIAIDSEWGNGKTFFVKQVKLILDIFANDKKLALYLQDYYKEKYNLVFNVEDQKIFDELRMKSNELWERLTQQKEIKLKSKYISVYYDAWFNDNDDDPILSIIYNIIKSLNGEYDVIEWNLSIRSLLDDIAETIKCGVGSVINLFANLVQKDDFLAKIKETKSLQQKINDFFEIILKERNTKLLIFIDELDRCCPNYAVKLLERIKHYFVNEKIIFVFSVNLNQLEKTIKSHYGNDIEANRYLDRFFDFRINLSTVDLISYCGLLSEEITENDVKPMQSELDDVCQTIAKNQRFTIREFEKFYRCVNLATNNYFHNNKDIWDNNKEVIAVYFCERYVIPCLIALKIINQQDYYDFIAGESRKLFISLLKGIDYGKLSVYFSGINNNLVSGKEHFCDCLGQAYTSLFLEQQRINSNYGAMNFTEKVRKKVLNIANLLSEETEYKPK